MTKPCPDDLAAFKHEPADYEQPVGRDPMRDAAPALYEALEAYDLLMSVGIFNTDGVELARIMKAGAAALALARGETSHG